MKLTLKEKKLVKEYAKKLVGKKVLKEGRDNIVDPKTMSNFFKAIGADLTKIDKSSTNWTTLKTDVDIPIQSIPAIFRPVFASITLNKVMIGFDPDFNGWWLDIKYSWKHYTGSNGLNLRLFSKDDGKTWEA